MNQIRLTGGEPLVSAIFLYWQLIQNRRAPTIFHYHERLLSENLAQPLKDAGITRINISLTYAPIDLQNYKTILSDAMEALTRTRCGFDPIKNQLRAIRGFTDDEIVDFLKWGRDKRLKPVYRIYASGWRS